LLAIKGLGEDDLTLILDTAESFKEISRRPIKKVPALRGQTIINLFYEPRRSSTCFTNPAPALGVPSK